MMGCKVDGCDGKHKGHGYCMKHWERWRRHGDPLAGGAFRKPRPAQCVIANCTNKPQGRGMCSKHYRRWRAHGDPSKVKWKYGAPGKKEWHRLSGSGYVVRYDPQSLYKGPNGYVYQHREVVGEIIGRPLLRTENVHHVNGHKDDNRPENLELWISGQPAGQRIQDLVSWARSLLRQYGDLADKMA